MKRARSGARQFSVGIFILTAVLSGATELPRRIPSNIDDRQTFVLKGHTRPVIAQGLAEDHGTVAGSHVMPRMSIHFTMTAAQRADLEQLLADRQNRRSPQYHRFLTPEEYARRFGLNSADVEKVTRWLEESGFSNVLVARGRAFVSFSGTAGHVHTAFHTAIHKYSLNGEEHFANARDPQLPKALEGMVESIRGLHNFGMKPHIRRAEPRFNWGDPRYNYHFLAPDDWQTIYNVKPLYSAGFDGTGVTIAVVGQTDIQISDIQAFRSAAGLPANNPTVLTPPGYTKPAIVSGDETEADLDLEWSGGIAKNATILFVTISATVDNGVEDSITYAIDHNLAPIVSTSYGQCEALETAAAAKTMNSLFQQASVQGMTIVAASGDKGGAGCDAAPTGTSATHGLAADFPASSPYVTGIGGTQFSALDPSYWSATNNSSNGSALSYIPETVWNYSDYLASGGGASAVFTKPPWQSGLGVPNDGQRDVPDLALAASPYIFPYLVCESGSCINGFANSNGGVATIGGTSAGAPTFSGLLALLVQKTGARLGNINPNLYSLGQISTTAFHDITSGDSYIGCQPGTPDCGLTPGLGYPADAGSTKLQAGVR